ELCWEAFRRESAHVDRFIAVSDYYGRRMAARLELEEGKMSVVYNGIDVAGFEPAETDPDPPAVGYLSRMCPPKGLHILVEAFLQLKQRGKVPGAVLRIGGARTREDENYVAQQQARIDAAGYADDVSWFPNMERAQKAQFLRSLSLLSVPAPYGEAFGLYLLEAMASGVAVVEPDDAGFPEILSRTGGGVLYRGEGPADVDALSRALEDLLLDGVRRRELGAAGREAVCRDFTARDMARRFSEVLQEVVERR
ncbi:MAG: glycosyltransferase family 4 protein, partial [Verrucomicrobiales bacterium]